MDADPGDVVASSLHFTGVHTNAHFHADLPGALTDREPTLNRSRRTIEGGEDAISSRLDLSTAEAMNLAPGHTVMVVEQLTPATVSAAGRVGRRGDDVGKQNRCQHPVGVQCSSCSGQKLFDVVEQPIRVAGKREVVSTGQLDE